jgi:hypothetical protein
MIYYIYEVPGHKNGATTDWDTRFQYNFNQYQIEPIVIETMEGPDNEEMWQLVGDREWELAEQNGYPKGMHYKSIRIVQSRANTTDAKRKISEKMTGLKRGETSKEHKQKLSDSLKTLTHQQVEEILFKYVPRKYSTLKLAKEYSVSQPTIWRVIKNATMNE